MDTPAPTPAIVQNAQPNTDAFGTAGPQAPTTTPGGFAPVDTPVSPSLTTTADAVSAPAATAPAQQSVTAEIQHFVMAKNHFWIIAAVVSFIFGYAIGHMSGGKTESAGAAGSE